jgi:uncharacterized membrane protein YdjX (TVP38/TMEM64 family)
MKKQNVFLLIAIVSIMIWYRQPLIDFVGTISDQQAVSAYLQSYGSLGPIVLFILMVAQVFVAVIPGHALMVTAGYVYGGLGLSIVIVSTILGSQVAFWIARRYGRSLIYRIASREILEKWDSAARHQGILFYFFAFVLPIFPSDLMCYVAGLSSISARHFLVANVLGRSVVAISITLIGMYGMHPPAWFWITAILILSSFFTGWMIYKRMGQCVAQGS